MSRNAIVVPGSSVKWESLGGHRELNAENQFFGFIDKESGINIRAMNSIFTGESYSPRHGHNFDQIRFNLEGEVTYRDQTFGPGTCSYFPEGVKYGPAKYADDKVHMIALQFPGPSMEPMFSSDDNERAMKELVAQGATFEKGVCKWPSGNVQDGFEAVWEHLAGRPVNYPKPRYLEPICMDPANFPWQSSHLPGIAMKRLSYMNESGPNVQMFRLEPKAKLEGRTEKWWQILFVVEGEIESDGQTCPTVSVIFCPPNSTYEATGSQSGATILAIAAKAPNGIAPPFHLI